MSLFPFVRAASVAFLLSISAAAQAQYTAGPTGFSTTPLPDMPADAPNFLTNGSFEATTGPSITGWTFAPNPPVPMFCTEPATQFQSVSGPVLTDQGQPIQGRSGSNVLILSACEWLPTATATVTGVTPGRRYVLEFRMWMLTTRGQQSINPVVFVDQETRRMWWQEQRVNQGNGAVETVFTDRLRGGYTTGFQSNNVSGVFRKVEYIPQSLPAMIRFRFTAEGGMSGNFAPMRVAIDSVRVVDTTSTPPTNVTLEPPVVTDPTTSNPSVNGTLTLSPTSGPNGLNGVFSSSGRAGRVLQYNAPAGHRSDGGELSDSSTIRP